MTEERLTASLAGLSVGDALAARTGMAGIPAGWLAAREPLPDWLGDRLWRL